MRIKDKIVDQEQLGIEKFDAKQAVNALEDVIESLFLQLSTNPLILFAAEMRSAVENWPDASAKAYLRIITAPHYGDFIETFKDHPLILGEELERGGWREIGLFAQVLTEYVNSLA